MDVSVQLASVKEENTHCLLKQEAALSALLPSAAGAGLPADRHVPILSLTAAEPSGVLCANPNSLQPLPKPSRAQCCPGTVARALGEVVLRLPASVPAEAGITWPSALAAGRFLAEVTHRQGTLRGLWHMPALKHCLQPPASAQLALPAAFPPGS